MSESAKNLVNRLRQEVLELKHNEQFIKKLIDEVVTVREALDNSDVELLEKCFGQ